MRYNSLRDSGVYGADIANLHTSAALDALFRIDLILGPLVVDGVDGTFQSAVVAPQTEWFDLVSHSIRPF